MNLHGMTPERYIEILERTIRQLKDENQLATKRIAELLDERDASQDEDDPYPDRVMVDAKGRSHYES